MIKNKTKKSIESIELYIKDYMPPGYPCNMEDKVKNKVKGVMSVVINPNTESMKVVFDPHKSDNCYKHPYPE